MTFAFAKAVFANFSLLIALAYMFDLAYRYLFQYAPSRVKYGITVAVFILGGWLAMAFGLRVDGLLVLDLRFLPLIIAMLVFPSLPAIALIGFGIGIGRLFIGLDASAFMACLNMIVLGLICTWMSAGLRWKSWSFLKKSIITLISVNVIFALNATLVVAFGSKMSVSAFWLDYGIYSFPLRLLLSGLLIFIIRDFQKEQQRVDELRKMNMLLRRQTRELRQAKRDVEEKARELMLANKYKSEFLANMSHELKTPLNSIIMLSQLMKESEEERGGGAEEAQYSGLINGAGHELLQLIDDILDLSKVEAGKMDIYMEPHSVEELVQTLYLQFLPVAAQKGLTFETEIGSQVPEAIYTDALRINQILRNLLANAFKFTETGSVRLIVKAEGGVPIEPGQLRKRRLRSWNPVAWGRPAVRIVNPLRIAFSIADTGIGIEPEKQQLIFEAFRQEDGSINRKYGGTGLGLSISLQLTRLLGGTLALESQKGEGSKFTLRLPATQTGTDSEKGTGSEGSAPGDRGLRMQDS
ncbi:histidine kinase [Paenibacillus rhizovicinus]|uniref:Circadian input-output histidine kinase CikA n=1 Tax=Paenibacillus rhizovicinus TaxID=2704463 RepID=A0A6C0NZE9_9BACL|nr:ATP-binding protein [Paenibacillus rhizovicinus]QHW31598.1 histidine kinase [Paenibacillus rhizovicinus]